MPSVIAVAASDYSVTRLSSSDWGDCVALFAPGMFIMGAKYTSDTDYTCACLLPLDVCGNIQPACMQSST
jgi:hypothetical protein